VGVGTTTPTNQLDILTSGGGTAIIRSSNSALRFVSSGGENYIQSGTAATSSSPAPLIFSNVGGINETMRITSAGNVGIGTSSPTYLLDTRRDQNGITAFRVYNASSGSSAYSALYFGNDVNQAQAGFFTTSSTNNAFGGTNSFNIWTQGGASPAPIVFCPNNTERMRITSAGYTQFGADGTTSTLSITPTVTSRPSTSAPMIQTTGGGGSGVYANAGQLIISGRPTDTSTFGNIYIQTGATQQNQWIFNNGAAFVLPGGTATATGTGITFPSTQSASSDANTLDDYEEGTWTPGYTLSLGSASSVTSAGSYIKIGRSVTVTFFITFGSVSSASIDSITGLPFTVVSASQQAMGVLRESSVTGELWQIRANSNATTLLIRKYQNSDVLTSGFLFTGTVTYFSAA
jgi:hypothetical protein